MTNPKIEAEKLYYRAEFNNHMDNQRRKKILEINLSSSLIIFSSILMLYAASLAF